MGFRLIGRMLGVNNVAVLKWIRAAGEWIQNYHQQHKAQPRPSVEVIEMDEIWHYAGSKKEIMGLVCIGAKKEKYTWICHREPKSKHSKKDLEQNQRYSLQFLYDRPLASIYTVCRCS